MYRTVKCGKLIKNMNQQQRSSFPSQAQIEALMEFLEENPRLAKGVHKIASARDRSRKLWEKQSFHLNSLGGSNKSWRQWRKYWADKKNAVRKKAAQRFAERLKNGDKTEEIIELTNTEERILGMMGGDGFDTEEFHLGLKIVPPSPSTDMSLNSSTVEMQEESEESIEQADAPSLDVTTSLFPNFNPSACNHTVARESSLTLNPTRLPRNTYSRRTRRMAHTVAMTPSTQRRSQYVSLAERFLKAQENRLEMNRRYATIIENLLEQEKERDRAVAQALSCLGEGLYLISHALKK